MPYFRFKIRKVLPPQVPSEGGLFHTEVVTQHFKFPFVEQRVKSLPNGCGYWEIFEVNVLYGEPESVCIQNVSVDLTTTKDEWSRSIVLR